MKRKRPTENDCLACEMDYELVTSPYHRPYHVCGSPRVRGRSVMTFQCLNPDHRKTPRERLRWARRLHKEIRKP